MSYAARLIKDKAQTPGSKRIAARFDAAQSTPNNERHWANVDSLDADASTNSFVRSTLRMRSRYELSNNTYAHGIATTRAHDIVGTSPRLQMKTTDERFNRIVEDQFKAWAGQVKLADKLRTARYSQTASGEAFLFMVDNDAIRFPVQLDLRVVEADQVADPTGMAITNANPNYVDGITYDDKGNPLTYDLLDEHPGSEFATFTTTDFQSVDSRFVIHMFKRLRPGQSRGIPEFTQALPLFAQLRRYTLAVVRAAETAAANAYVIQTQHPSLDPMDTTPFETIDIDHNMMTVMPAGWTASQMAPEQPTNTYADFKREILNEIARVLEVPFNVAAGNSSGYNYSSGRLDHQSYFKAIKIEQFELSHNVLDRIFNQWFFLAARQGILGQIPRNERMRREWFFDGFEHVDPLREATAQALRLENFSTTYADEYAKQGKDWQQQLAQVAREREMMDQLGITTQEVQASSFVPHLLEEGVA